MPCVVRALFRPGGNRGASPGNEIGPVPRGWALGGVWRLVVPLPTGALLVRAPPLGGPSPLFILGGNNWNGVMEGACQIFHRFPMVFLGFSRVS